ncbi:hypothetical protein KRR38_14625 [Novosphingobium sp. G106]|uniref:hypothetical protein n=1 Tax=Novosphingobium sp. G106 TaxID=2849500 RepID=UPI001C2DCDAB|nr:hypothetical protein [Novosphingobium sp. G106]MBV1688873.1 hypothetical protein [Novosphingobium sp. G106]
MDAVRTFSIIQTAVVTHSRSEGVARVADLFAAVPVDLEGGSDAGKVKGTVIAFANGTNFEVLDPLEENHTRYRFLRRNGPGAYMLSCSLENEDWKAVGESFAAHGVRAVVEGPFGQKHLYRWHLHPKDAGGLLILTSVMKDRDDNADWAGENWANDIPFNTRFVEEIRGYAARTLDPVAESETFGKVGFTMRPLAGGGMGWRGPTGNVLELWPQDSWDGPAVDQRRDFAVVLKASNREGLLRRMSHLGFTFMDGVAGRRILSSIDPVLGVRFAIET